MGLLRTAVIVIILGALVKFIGQSIIFLDVFKTIQNHAPGPCRIVEGVENGSEDIQVLPNGLAFISSGLKFLKDVGNPKRKHIKGKIHLFDFNKPDSPPFELKLVGGPDWEDFAPHGISLWQDKAGSVYVYVVNHLVSGDQIEKFLFDGKSLSLKHVKSIKHDIFRITNDLVVIGEDKFYITNYMWSLGSIGWTFESIFRPHWGQVVYYDGSKGQIVADGFFLPNGINISPDKKFVYLALPGEKTIQIFSRQPDNSLQHKQTVSVETCPDNLDVNTESGQVELWTGSHPIGWRVLQYLEHQRDDAPSQVLRLVVEGDQVTSVTEVYAELDHRLFGSTVATKFKDAMLVGTIRHKLMYCKLLYVGI